MTDKTLEAVARAIRLARYDYDAQGRYGSWSEMAAQAAIAAYNERECVWIRRGSPATEEWIDTDCGLREVDINHISDETPVNYCPNCGGKIIEPREAQE